MVGTSGAQLPEGIGPAARRLAQELRALKEALGLTLTQLGAQTHYSRASWERWLNGKRLITPDALASLATRYNVDIAPLLALLELARCGDDLVGGVGVGLGAGVGVGGVGGVSSLGGDTAAEVLAEVSGLPLPYTPDLIDAAFGDAQAEGRDGLRPDASS